MAPSLTEERPQAALNETTEFASRENPSHEDIARLAYALWEVRGGADGSAEDDWYRAEAELRRR
jgi:Protein of unknown function (DUF2934)